ncbi:MAG: VWA domain-containing protein [Paludibaculum sp.]
MLLQAQDQVPTFRVTARLVEVYATVFDRQDRRIGGLREQEFNILDGGNPQRIEKFEASTEGLALTIVMDTTGSMRDSLPVVKNAISLLIDQLREEDQVAVYGFAGSLDRLQEFTRDKRAAKLAVRRTRAEGRTALFDAFDSGLAGTTWPARQEGRGRLHGWGRQLQRPEPGNSRAPCPQNRHSGLCCGAGRGFERYETDEDIGGLDRKNGRTTVPGSEVFSNGRDIPGDRLRPEVHLHAGVLCAYQCDRRVATHPGIGKE